MKGRMDISTPEGQSLGHLQFRGQCTREELIGSEVTFIQMMADPGRHGPGYVTALALRTCKLQDRLQKYPVCQLSDLVTETLAPSRRLRQGAATSSSLSAAAPTPKPWKWRPNQTECPRPLQIAADGMPAAHNIFIGSRLGVLFIESMKWMQLHPSDAIVFLI